MSWLSNKWDQLSGKNQKIAQSTVNDEYNDAFGGARDTYGVVEKRGMDMMDPDSQFNLQQKERMEGSAADAAAMSSRMAGRNAAMSGGANAASLAAQTASGANQAQAGAIGAYNQYLSGAMSQGAGMASGAANNMAQMNQTQMNALQANRQANRQIDSQATAFGANMLGRGLSKIFQEGGSVGSEDFKPHMMYKDNVSQMANTYDEHLKYKKDGYSERKMASGGKVSMYQKGGYAESSYGNRGGMLSQVMGPDGMPMNIRTRIGGQIIGE